VLALVSFSKKKELKMWHRAASAGRILGLLLSARRVIKRILKTILLS
jgi:hypothetical protein